MPMKIKSFGCSFIFGTELSDQYYENLVSIPSKLTWPALIAKQKNLEYKCYAHPGSGNTRIAEQILNQIQSQEPAVYIIGWSWIERFDYYNTDNLTMPWKTITAWSKDKIGDFYYRNIHSQYWDKLNSLMLISLCLNQLQASNSVFLMTYMDELLFENNFHHSPGMALLQQQIKPFLHNFDGMNFLEWSLKNNFPIGPKGKHPLDQAHEAAAQYILNHNLV